MKANAIEYSSFQVANIGGSLIAVLAFIGFLNGVLGWFGSLVGFQGLTIELILGKIFVPLAWVMGTPAEVTLGKQSSQ